MRPPTLRPWPPVLPAGEDTLQEFVAGTIPVTRVVTESNQVVVLVEHQWGILRVFDEYLDAIRERRCRPEGSGYTITWVGMAGGEPRETLIRLELRIDGLRARPRLLLHGKREAVTLRARQVVFEGGRAAPAASTDSAEPNGADPEQAVSADTEPAGVASASDAGAASADDLPF